MDLGMGHTWEWGMAPSVGHYPGHRSRHWDSTRGVGHCSGHRHHTDHPQPGLFQSQAGCQPPQRHCRATSPPVPPVLGPRSPLAITHSPPCTLQCHWTPHSAQGTILIQHKTSRRYEQSWALGRKTQSPWLLRHFSF